MSGPISFGRYVLLEKLATGGMAEIFLAKAVGEAGFEKTCVIKRVLPHLASTPGFVEMFLDEAHLAARLNHPGIVQIFDLGRQGEDYFLAMEYLAGEDVHAVLRQSARAGKAMPLDVAARIIACAAEALHYAHEARAADGTALGIVHRDISPSNLFVTYQGAVKVLDFGIARAGQRLQHTRAGQVKGKVAYVAPEQARGLGVDRRTDVWALGVCLHEMLTGQRLFARDHAALTLEAVTAESPVESPRLARPDIPEELEAAVMTALARSPDARFATAEALRAALDRFLAERTYVPQTVLLSQYLRGLFGDERADGRLQRVAAPAPQAQRGAATDEMAASPGPADKTLAAPSSDQAEAKTVVVPSLVQPPAPGPVGTRELPLSPAGGPPIWRAHRLGLVALVALAVAAVGLGIGAVARRPPERAGAPDAGEGTGTVAVAPPATAPALAPAAVSDAGPADAGQKRVAADPRPVPAVERPRPQSGLLSVEANTPVTVTLDGARLGGAPISRVRVPAGEHRLKLENAALGISRAERIVVRAGEEKLHRANFQKGKLNVTVVPWADVWVDGTKLGQTPLAAREVWEGRHKLRLVGPLGEKTVTVEVVAGQTAVVREKLP